jgi:hypothetical protein
MQTFYWFFAKYARHCWILSSYGKIFTVQWFFLYQAL